MRGRAGMAWGLAVLLAIGAGSCGRKRAQQAGPRERTAKGSAPAAPPGPPAPPPEPPRWVGLKPPGKGQVLALFPDRAQVMPPAEARAAGLMVIDLGDEWAPFIFSDSDGPADPAAAPTAEGDAAAGPEVKPNAYRRTFVDLANDRVDPEELFLAGAATRELDMSPEAEERRKREARERRAGKRPPPEPPRAPPRKHSEPVRNYLEVFGIPPTLSVLARRIEQDGKASCWASLDRDGLARFSGSVTYQNAKQARRDHDEVDADRAWLAQRLAQLGDAGAPGGAPDGGALAAADAGAVPWGELGLEAPPAGVLAQLRALPKDAARLERALRGQARRRAIRAAQARLACEGLLGSKSRYVDGMFDLPTHEALAAWERKNDIFGWGFLGEETLAGLLRPPLDLHLDTFRRIVTERLADQAGIIEDGSVGTKKRTGSYHDAEGRRQPVPNLIDQHLQALLAALQIRGPDDLVLLLRTLGRKGLHGLQVAFAPPPLPPYYAPHMELEVEIDRGDIWYDFPFGPRGQTAEQKREHYPTLTLLTNWNDQRIPLARWRTTIGSWRSELHPDGFVYYKYKNSDVGPRIWKQVVAAPVWVPPDSTPAGDLLTRKIFDIRKGPVPVVNTDVMGPGFQSAYGLVMAIHHKLLPGGGLFDNQIRTHGSVDYTSIARRFSHGCHRLVNTRAVRLFDFVLRHRTHLRQGDNHLGIRKVFSFEGRRYGYELDTRGYYYELTPPLPVNVLEGRIVGKEKKPITSYIRKPGVLYQASSAHAPGAEGESAPALGP